jgi:hypothetical protein
VEVGAVVAAGTMVAELFASDQLEVVLPLGLDDFGFLDRDENGMARGTVTLRGRIGGEWHEWEASPLRIVPEIERRTLSGSLVVRVERREGAEFSLPPVGLFVEAELTGKRLAEVVEIPRRALLEGGKLLTVDERNRIEFRDVDVVRSSDTTVIVSSGLEAGERVILTRVSAAVMGMEVVIESPEESQ